MKQLLLNPLILTMVLAIVIIYVAIGFHYISRDQKLSAMLEKVAIGIFLISLAEVSVLPFNKLTPMVLANRETTLPTIVGQVGFSGIILICLASRLRYTLKDIVYVISVIVIRAPFLWNFCLIIAFSAFWSNEFTYSLKTSLVYLVIAMVAVYVGKQYSWKEIYSLMRWVNMVILLLSIYYSNLVPSVGIHKSGSWQGILSHKNQFSFWMTQTLVLWLIYGIYHPKERKLAFGISAVALFAMNRGGSGASKILFLCLIVMMFYLNILKELQPKWAFVSVVIFMIISTSLMIILIDNIEFIVVDTLNKDLTITGRTLFWPIIIDKINQKPVFGYGVAGFWQGWKGLDNPANNVSAPGSGFHPPHSHNGFLDIATDLGWLGMSLYILSFLNTLAKAVIYLSHEKMPEGGLPLLLLTFILMTNLTETGLLDGNRVWFWYVAMVTRLSLDIKGSY